MHWLLDTNPSGTHTLWTLTLLFDSGKKKKNLIFLPHCLATELDGKQQFTANTRKMVSTKHYLKKIL